MLAEVGTYEITYRATDAAGNAGGRRADVVKVDGSAADDAGRRSPAAARGAYRGPGACRLTAADGAGGSGVAPAAPSTGSTAAR